MAKRRRSANWLELPEDLTLKIFLKVGVIDILNAVQRVCTSWRRISKDPSMWRSIDLHGLGDFHRTGFNFEAMCRHAVDRSNGQLESINIEYFGTDDLLIYIADRSSRLSCLRLVCCYDIEDEGLSEAAAKLPLLEELELSLCKNVLGEALEVVGSSCPLLKSLKLNRDPYELHYGSLLTLEECNKEALAIAKDMHGLRHLELFGNNLSNVGLEAILDGCPNLESLDLRRCFNVILEGEFGKRCAEKIKDLRRPNDSLDDYKYFSRGYNGYLASLGYPDFEDEFDVFHEDDIFDENGFDVFHEDGVLDENQFDILFAEDGVLDENDFDILDDEDGILDENGFDILDDEDGVFEEDGVPDENDSDVFDEGGVFDEDAPEGLSGGSYYSDSD